MTMLPPMFQNDTVLTAEALNAINRWDSFCRSISFLAKGEHGLFKPRSNEPSPPKSQSDEHSPCSFFALKKEEKGRTITGRLAALSIHGVPFVCDDLSSLEGAHLKETSSPTELWLCYAPPLPRLEHHSIEQANTRDEATARLCITTAPPKDDEEKRLSLAIGKLDKKGQFQWSLPLVTPSALDESSTAWSKVHRKLKEFHTHLLRFPRIPKELHWHHIFTCVQRLLDSNEDTQSSTLLAHVFDFLRSYWGLFCYQTWRSEQEDNLFFSQALPFQKEQHKGKQEAQNEGDNAHLAYATQHYWPTETSLSWIDENVPKLWGEPKVPFKLGMTKDGFVQKFRHAPAFGELCAWLEEQLPSLENRLTNLLPDDISPPPQEKWVVIKAMEQDEEKNGERAGAIQWTAPGATKNKANTKIALSQFRDFAIVLQENASLEFNVDDIEMELSLEKGQHNLAKLITLEKGSKSGLTRKSTLNSIGSSHSFELKKKQTKKA